MHSRRTGLQSDASPAEQCSLSPLTYPFHPLESVVSGIFFSKIITCPFCKMLRNKLHHANFSAEDGCYLNIVTSHYISSTDLEVRVTNRV